MSTGDDAPPPLETPGSSNSSTGSGINENTWSMIAHLSGLVGYIGNGIGMVIAPLVIWLIKKDKSAKIAEHAKEALNFNITIAICGLALALLVIVTFGVGIILAIPLGIALAIFHLVCVILAAIKANEGKAYRYPFALRLVK